MSHVHTDKWLLDRRHVLRGAGASVALPLLNCMIPSRAACREAANLPKRCVFIYVPNGVNTLTWQIETAGAGYEFPEPLRALEDHRSEITPISGLHHPNGVGKNHRCEKIWLTAAELDNSAGKFRNTISADQLMATVAGADTRFPSLELAITGGTLAWSADGIPLPAARKPRAVFNRLFGIDPGGVDRARRELNQRASVLDLVLDDARRTRRSLGTEDRVKLDEYLNAVRDVELRTHRAEAWLNTPKPKVDPETTSRLTREIPYSEAGNYYRTVYDLMLLALRTDVTRVITCMSGSESFGLAIPEIGIRQTRHELSHHNGIPEKMEALTRCDAFLVDQFAYFLRGLRTHAEQGESLLDLTMVLFGSGMAHGHSHGNANLPTILAGGKSLGISHGRHLDYNLPAIGGYDLADPMNHYRICTRPVDDRARLSNLLLTMLQGMDVNVESFGDSLGPISELVS